MPQEIPSNHREDWQWARDFEFGKYYRHTTGKELHIIGEITCLDLFINPSLAAEDLYGTLSSVGTHDEATTGWLECEPWVIKDQGIHSHLDIKVK